MVRYSTGTPAVVIQVEVEEEVKMKKWRVGSMGAGLCYMSTEKGIDNEDRNELCISTKLINF